MEGVVGHRHGLLKALGLIIDASGPHRVHVPPVLLVLRVNFRIAVHLTRARDEHPGALGPGETQTIVGPERAHLERLDGNLEVIDGTRRRRKVQDVIQFALDVNELADVVVVELEAVEPREVFDVAQVARDEVVHPDHVVPLGDEAIAEVGAEESGRAGDQDALHLAWVPRRPMEVYSQPCLAMSATS